MLPIKYTTRVNIRVGKSVSFCVSHMDVNNCVEKKRTRKREKEANVHRTY